MIQTLTILPGVTLRCRRDHRFKQSCLSIQLVRPMCREEAAMNALLPAVLLRGCRNYPDLRAITMGLDDLYGASVSALVRRIGDYQTTGFYCAFIQNRFALKGDAVLVPMMDFVGQLLRDPDLRDGVFRADYVESEKKNLIATIESEKSDKRAYAAGQLLRNMCREDSFGVPRLGDVASVEAIDGEKLYRHYEKILAQSPVELFYVGSAEPEQVAQALRPLFEGLSAQRAALPGQTAFHDAGASHTSEEMDVAQAKLCMGFTTPVTNRDPRFAAMQVLNTVFGAGMTSKLFMNIREKMSLCYAIGSGYYGTKGILTVSAGIDTDKEDLVRREVMAQLEACQKGDITRQELDSAKEAILSSLRGVHDAPGAVEGYYGTAALSGGTMDLESYRKAVEQVDLHQAVEAANSLKLHSSFFLKGVAE